MTDESSSVSSEWTLFVRESQFDLSMTKSSRVDGNASEVCW